MSSRRKGKPQQRKKIDNLEPEQDYLTCGECQKDFLLSDIVKFIQHKINRCNKENVDPFDDNDLYEGDDDDDDSSVVSNSFISNRRTSISAPIAQRKANTPDKLSPRPPVSLTIGNDEEAKSDHSHGRPQCQDASANTVTSEPTTFMCGQCKLKLTSAWDLVKHAQSKHHMKLYVEDATPSAVTPRASPQCEDNADKASHASEAVPDDICANSSASSSPSQKLLAAANVQQSGRASGAATMRTPPVSMTSDILGTPPAFTMFRMPSDRTPLTSGIGQGPFSRPICMDFMSPDPFQRMPQPNLHPLGFDHQSPLTSGFPNPFERLRPPLINPPSGDSQDFYSQRLRLLANAGTTSPTPASPGPPSRSGKHTPPYSSGQPPSAVTSPIQQRTSPFTGSPNEVTPGADSNGKEMALPGKVRACEFCGKCFRFQSNLIVHRRSHTGEKPFQCPLCPHACTQASKLKRHMKTHNIQMSISYNASRASSASTTSEHSGGARSTTSTPESKNSKVEDDDETEDEEDEESFINEARRIGALATDDNEEYARERAELLGEEPDPADISSKRTRASLLKEVMKNTGLDNIKQYSDAFEQALADTKDKEESKPKRPRSESVSDDITENGHSEKESNDEDKESSRMSCASQDQDNISESSYGKRIKLEPHEGLPFQPMEYSRMWGFPGIFGMTPHIFQNDHHFPFPPHSGAENGLSSHSDGPFKLDGTSPKASTSLTISPGTASAPSTPTGLSGSFSRRSTPSRNDTCEFCGKIFKNCSNLTVHRRSHTGEKPYQCRLCNYACAQSSKLTRHMKTHGRYGKDVYRCKFCSMPFSVPSTLEKHMRKCVENQPNQRAALMAAASAMNPSYNNHPSSSPSSV